MSSPSADGNRPGGYRGRRGWGPGALWDSLCYLFAFVAGRVERRRLMRRLQSKRSDLEGKREETIRKLGKVGLYMDGVDHPVVVAHIAERDELDSLRAELVREIEKSRRDGESERKQAAARITGLRKALDDTRRHRREVQDGFDALVEERQAYETKAARAEFEVDFNEKAVAQAEAELDLLAARNAPVHEIRRVRTRLKKARIALERAQSDLPKFRQDIKRVDELVARAEKDLNEARGAEQRARDDLDRAIEDRDARAWERHKEELRLEDRLDDVGRKLNELFCRAGKDIFANRIAHPGFEGWYDRIGSLDAGIEETDLALMALDNDKKPLDWRPLFRTGVWSAGLVLFLLLILRIAEFLSH